MQIWQEAARQFSCSLPGGGFCRRFEAKKRERNLVDFNDLEHLALQVLYQEEKEGREHKPGEAAIFWQGSDEILGDEYQGQQSGAGEAPDLGSVQGTVFGTPLVFTGRGCKVQSILHNSAWPDRSCFWKKFHSSTKEDQSSIRRLSFTETFQHARRQVLERAPTTWFTGLCHGESGTSYLLHRARQPSHPGASF